MPNELPKQLYVARFTLKCGAVFDVITELTREQIAATIRQASKIEPITPALITGTNAENGWPVDAVIYDDVAAFIHAPFKQYLLARPNLSVS